MMTRDEVVQSLVRFDRPLAALRDSIASFPFDWDDPPVATLTRGHVLDVLERWQRGELDASEVEEWANLVEVRDDLDHDPADPAVADAMFDLANPELQGPLHEVGPALTEKLKA
jgi:hypothetical protein